MHQVYNEELLRQNKLSRHAEMYNDLPENVKDLDRALARYINNFILPQALKDCQENIKKLFEER